MQCRAENGSPCQKRSCQKISCGHPTPTPKRRRKRKHSRGETGAVLVETGILISLIALVALTAVSNLGGAIAELFCDGAGGLYENPTSTTTNYTRDGFYYSPGAPRESEPAGCFVVREGRNPDVLFGA